jgi:hypothetical protein
MHQAAPAGAHVVLQCSFRPRAAAWVGPGEGNSSQMVATMLAAIRRITLTVANMKISDLKSKQTKGTFFSQQGWIG